MLYYLSLLTHTDQLAFFRLFRYLTFRSGAAVMTALAIAFFINPMLIRWLKIKQGKGQPIRSDGPQRHIVEKAGTPTMGGILILIPWLGSTLLWAQLSNRYVWIVLLVTVAYGLLGFLDDYYKVTKRTSDGLSGRARLAIEFVIAFLATWLIMQVGSHGPVGRAGDSLHQDGAAAAGFLLHPDRRLCHCRRRQCGEFHRWAGRAGDRAGDHRRHDLHPDRLSGRQ